MVKIIKDFNVCVESVASDEGKVVVETFVSKIACMKQQLHGLVILGHQLMRTVFFWGGGEFTTLLITFVEANRF